MAQPYFYIIEHVATGRKYAGSRWEDGCNPNELMQEGGYQTSSLTVHEIIKREGLDAFKIVEVKQLDDPYSYETEFLKRNQCAQSEEWLNKHNNDSAPPPYGSIEFKQMMLEKYGVTHNTHIPGMIDQMMDKRKEHYNDNPHKKFEIAKKIAEAKKRNGTTGKGTKRPNYTNKGLTGKWERTEEWRKKLSEYQKINSYFSKNNPMNDPEKRKLVSLSKIGKKKYMNLSTNETRMFLPGTEPEGFVLASKGKQ